MLNTIECQVPDSYKLSQVTKDDSRLRKWLKVVNDELQKAKIDNSQSSAVVELEASLGKLEAAYSEINKVAEDYGKEYEKTYKEKKKENQERLNKLTNRTNDQNNPGDKFRCKIDDIRREDYENVDKDLKCKRDTAFDNFEKIQQKACLDKSEEDREQAKLAFEKAKKYKDDVKGWFDDLEKLFNQATELLNLIDPKQNDRQKYQAAYAIKLEFEDIFNDKEKVGGLRNKEEFEKWLTDELKKWVQAVYTKYYFHKDFLQKEAEYENAKSVYDTFDRNRRAKFIEDAQYLTDSDIQSDKSST